MHRAIFLMLSEGQKGKACDLILRSIVVIVQTPGIEPGTFRVLSGRHNQLDHACMNRGYFDIKCRRF